MLLVIGGTLGAGLASTTMTDFIRAFTGLQRFMLFKKPDMNESVDTIVKLADKARREGLLALEDGDQRDRRRLPQGWPAVRH